MKKTLLAAVSYFLWVNLAWAQNPPGGSQTIPGGQTIPNSGGGLVLQNPFGSDSLLGIIRNITGWLIALAIPIASVMILYAGYQIMFAAGDAKKVQGAYKTITYSLVGLAIIVLAWAFVGLLRQILGV